jgi:hypothetical protein
MTYRINTHDQHNPLLEIDVGDRCIVFTVASVRPKAWDWLGGVLDRQINEMIDRRVREALETHKKALRDLIGVQS